MTRRLLISSPITTLSSDDYHVLDLSTRRPVIPNVQIQRKHFFSPAFDVKDKEGSSLGTLSPKTLFMDTWHIKDTRSGLDGSIVRQTPAEHFTQYDVISEGQTFCTFKQFNTLQATEFYADLAEVLNGWNQSLLISVPLVMLASNPFIRSWRSDLQGGCL